MSFREVFEEEFKKSGMSQYAIGDKIGVSAASVNRYLKGKRKPNIDTIAKIATAFGTTVEHMLGME